MRTIGLLWLGLCFALAGGAARADTLLDGYGASISDEAASTLIELALERVQDGLCAPDKHCAPATADEFANPPITPNDSRQAMVVGVRSALTEFCGLDFERSYLSMMAALRKDLTRTPRQITLISLIHGLFMQFQLNQMEQAGTPCSDEMRAQLDTELPTRQQ